MKQVRNLRFEISDDFEEEIDTPKKKSKGPRGRVKCPDDKFIAESLLKIAQWEAKLVPGI